MMTSFEPAFGDQSAMATKTSGLAVTSLIFSLILCCPLTTILGPLLGLGAIVRIGRNPALKGRGLAVAAIILGIGFTVFQGFCARFAWEHFYRVMFTGPGTALVAGFAGDANGFRADFTGAAANATDEEVAAFVDELQDRYGAFQKSWISQDTAFPTVGATETTMTYVLTFANSTVDCEAVVVLQERAGGPPDFLLGSLMVLDSDLGDLPFPVDDADDEVNNGDAESQDGDASPTEDEQDEGTATDTGTGDGSD